MSGGAYTMKPDRRIRHLKDVLTGGPRTFDAVVIGAGKYAQICPCLLSQRHRPRFTAGVFERAVNV